jgi:hypothetical protein
MVIWKYPLDLVDEQCLHLPKGAKLLTVQVQDDDPQLWALCDELQPENERRWFGMYGTGNPMPSDPGSYIGTVQLRGGMLVFHFFEKGTV